MIDKLTKITPLAGASLIFFGVLKLIFYYSYFNIKIINYLNFQEIITSFLEDINILILFGLIMVLITMFTINTISKSTRNQVNVVFEKLENFVYKHKIKYLLFFGILIFVLVFFLKYEIINYTYFVIYLVVFSVFQFLTYIFISKNENNEIGISDLYIAIILGVSLTSSIFLLSQRQIIDTEKQKIEVTLITENEAIKCSKENKNIFVGKTNKYTFIKLNNSKKTIVIPNERILQYEYK